MNPAAAEYSIQMNYVEVMVELPWDEKHRIASI